MCDYNNCTRYIWEKDTKMSDESLYDVWIVVAFAVPFTLVPYLAYAYFRRSVTRGHAQTNK